MRTCSEGKLIKLAFKSTTTRRGRQGRLYSQHCCEWHKLPDVWKKNVAYTGGGFGPTAPVDD